MKFFSWIWLWWRLHLSPLKIRTLFLVSFDHITFSFSSQLLLPWFLVYVCVLLVFVSMLVIFVSQQVPFRFLLKQMLSSGFSLWSLENPCWLFFWLSSSRSPTEPWEASPAGSCAFWASCIHKPCQFLLLSLASRHHCLLLPLETSEAGHHVQEPF